MNCCREDICILIGNHLLLLFTLSPCMTEKGISCPETKNNFINGFALVGIVQHKIIVVG